MGSASRNSKVVPAQNAPRTTLGIAASLRTGCMVDTKFYLYSRKIFEGGASHLKQLYASSAILRGFSADLDVLLQSRGFKGSETVSLDLFELEDEDQVTEDYDFPGDDSDLESEDPVSISFPPAPQELNPSQPDDNPFSRDSGELGLRDGTEAITTAPNGISPCSPATYEVGDGDKAKPTNKDLAIALINVQAVTQTNFMRMGRVIVLKDTAFATWEALIHYIYFRETHFKDLRSRSTGPSPSKGSPGVQCSPKSMYRLADKYGIDTLKALALENIKKQLTVQNVIAECTGGHFRYTSDSYCGRICA
ncbi:hypothetical protein CPB85DRAFT_1340485 [Mucidula mucida]|nr:hypothetical protein CPB85DRAFT_1340485 [Mucidula mucida]